MDNSKQARHPGFNPLDTYTSAGCRFLIEVAAWIGGPWVAIEFVGAWWAAVPVACALLLLPAVFNTPGDKNTTGIPTPGPIRVCIEALLLVVAIYSAWLLWATWLAVAVTVTGALMVVFGIPRYKWLLQGTSH